MIKKVPTHQLKPGMYVVDLGSKELAGKVRHPVGFIADGKTLAELTGSSLKYVYIDTVRGLDTDDALAVPIASLEAAPSSPEEDIVTRGEVEHAQRIHASAIDTVSHVMRDVKLGHHINQTAVHATVDNIVSSVVKDHSALLCLGMIRSKDNYLMEHSVNVSVIVTLFARHIGYDQAAVHQIATGALLHDIGKIVIPPHILHKPGKLDNDEFSIMRSHAAQGRDILREAGFDAITVEMAGHHHEHIDGTGYPDQLTADALSEQSKMLAIVDVYDALTADRCYHNRLTPHEALRNMLTKSGQHFDATLLQRFIKSIGVYPIGAMLLLSDGRVGMVVANAGEKSLAPVVRVFFDQRRHCYISQQDVDLAATVPKPLTIVENLDPRSLNIDMRRFFE
ncbi:MAG: HD-GYP domain-containing protein [Methylococcaceae bacterium]|nr:MAG: HD-GYP domain-containing protein [Methylococcaceae bacterium]